MVHKKGGIGLMQMMLIVLAVIIIGFFTYMVLKVAP
jgi:hypothetical protein